MRTDVAVTGSLLEPSVARGMKPRVYDWARPDMFSMDQIRALSLLHERFATGLGESLPESPDGCHVCLVDQRTYGEVRALGGEGTACVAAATTEAGDAGVTESEGRRYFAQSRSAKVLFDEAAAEGIAREARALEAASPFSVILFFASMGGAFAPLFSDAAVLEGRVLPALRSAWKQRVRMPVLVGSRLGDACGVEAIADGAMILLVELFLAETGEKLTLIYPADHLRKILHLLG